jgi:5-methyltetrahydrofolate--homocysteine methyltransferase
MPYRPDWDQARERLIAWWQGEDLGRPVIHLTVPSGRDVKWPTAPDTFEQRFLDIDYVLARTEANWLATDYLAEAHPFTYADLGPASTSAFFGCDLIFHETTSWQTPCLETWDDWRPVFDPNNRWWRTALEMTEALAIAGRDKWITTPALGEDAFDAISHLRGPERLCFDLVDCPERLVDFRDWYLDLWPRLYDELFAITQRHGTDGSSAWLAVWGPRKTAALQCDFACLVSGREYEDKIGPGIAAMARTVDHVIYHWDGPGALQDMRYLLAIPEIRVIQWIPGEGNRPQTAWPNLLRHIAGYGKALQIYPSPEELLRLIEVIPPRLIYASMWMPSRDEAQAFLREVEARCREPRHYDLPTPADPYTGEDWYPLSRPI